MRHRLIGTPERVPGRFVRNGVLLAALALTASASPAAASITIGQLPATPIGNCTAQFDHAQKAVGTGNSYTVPATGGISSWKVTSWSTRANANANTALTLKIYRLVGGLTYSVVGHDGPRTLAVSSVNTFPANVPGVKPGDLLGFHTATAGTGCIFDGAAGDIRLFRGTPPSNLADGASGDFGELSSPMDARLNISAVLDPTNTFTLGTTQRNKKKGTATLTVNVPNPGELALSGNGVKTAGARAAAAVTAGAVTLTIRATGKKRKKLNQKGKAGLSPTVTYTPTGGTPTTQSTTLKLKLKRKLKKQ